MRWEQALKWSFLLGSGCSAPARPIPTLPEAPPAATAASVPAASSAPSSAPSPEAGPPPAPETLNVLLILVDSLRADMPWAGYPRAIAPNLTRLEAESVSYRRAYSVSSYTAKSVGALLSGKYPSTLKRDGYFFTRFSDEPRFFPELLQSAGIATLSAHAHRTMKQPNNLNQGFDDWEVVPGIGPDTRTDEHVTSDDLTDLALEMLERHSARRGTNTPFFLYLHYLDPHQKYLKHREAPDYGDGARDRYDAEVFFTDLHIGRLLEHCKRQPWFDHTAIIVSADHGEAFGEHGMYRHAFELWNVLTHVPLLFRVPGVAPRRIDVPRSQIDLGPTILELMGRRVPDDYAGTSLLAELHGAAPAPRPVLLDLPADSNNPPRRGLIDGRFKLLVFEDSGRRLLFDLLADPEEKHDLAPRQPEKLAELAARFDQSWSEFPLVRPYGGNRLVGGGVANGPR